MVLVFKANGYFEHQKAQRDLKPLGAIPDSFEVLAGGERLRIAASRAKLKWNKSITIGIEGEWYEVERQENGTAPRAYVYLLRRAPVSKILRAYEEYDLTSAQKLPKIGKVTGWVMQSDRKPVINRR